MFRMHGLWTAFSIWQFVLNFTISKPTNTVHNKPWHSHILPPPIQIADILENRVINNDVYNPKKLYEPKLLDNEWVEYPLFTISDQDKLATSKEAPGLFSSTSVRGYLRLNLLTMNFTVEWVDTKNYTSNLNSKGRGMELSDLVVFNGNLYTPDDKTGIVFRLTNKHTIPWTIESDGDGLSNKTFKAEWMTIKDDELIVGGYGKEYTDKQGNWLNDNPLWIKVIDRFGKVSHVNWTREFRAVRKAIGIEFPAYMIHESCQWSSIHQRYFFLPRKVSFEKYDSFKDDYRAGNYLITANEAFQEFNVVRIGGIFNPAHGYSAFQFVPGTNDTVIIALKTEELEGQPLASYYTIFNIDGSTIYVDETKIPGDYKLEGLEFVDWSKVF